MIQKRELKLKQNRIKDDALLIIQREIRVGIQQQVRNYIKNKKMSPIALARELNVNKSVISKWTNTKDGHNLSINTLVELHFKGVPIFKEDFALIIKNYKDTVAKYNAKQENTNEQYLSFGG